MVTLSHLLDPKQGICHHLVLDPLQGDAQGHGGGNHQHLHHAIVPRQLYHQKHHQILPRRERQGGLLAGGHRAARHGGVHHLRQHVLAQGDRKSMRLLQQDGPL